MGAALIIVPVFIVIAAVIWVTVAAGKTSTARREEDALPDDPKERREAELEKLRSDHADAGSPSADG
jgi:hypothetical protein